MDGVYRRYSDFIWLHDTLAELFPGVFVPALPPKKRFGNMDENFIADERRPGLERFLNRIAATPILADCVPFQMFVTRAVSFEDVQKDLKRVLGAHNVAASLTAFSHYYPGVMAQTLAPSAHADMVSLEEFLKHEETSLDELVDVADAIVTHSSKMLEATGKLTVGIAGVYALEKNYVALPGPQRCTAVETFTQWHTELKELEPFYTNSMLLALQWELYDVKQMLALTSSREARRKAAEKARKAADKWRGVGGQRPETDKQRQQCDADLRSESDENAMLEAMTKLILLDQHRQSWMTRVTDWSKAVGSFATGQASFNQRAYNSWVSLLAPPQVQ